MKLWRVVPAALAAAVAIAHPVKAEQNVEVIPRSEVNFQPLNPARGDSSPKAGVLWGDIKKNVASGAIIEFVDGFSSPPHIHNITYRAVVISGAVHNDDPKAERMWMGPGSFWTQPAGEPHITAAKKGESAVAFLEIFSGPYLVQPSVQAFDNGERPVNMASSNVVWLNASNVSWLQTKKDPGQTGTPQVAFLWGDMEGNEENGTFLKFPSGYSGKLRGNDAWLRAVVVQGQMTRKPSSNGNAVDLAPGSYFGASDNGEHNLSCKAPAECLLYVRTSGKYSIE